MKRISVLIVWAAMAAAALASPMVAAESHAPASAAQPSAEQVLDATADTTIQRLPTCEVTIRTRVSEWKASASIACKKSSAASAGCVAAQLTMRTEQLRRLRSCKFL